MSITIVPINVPELMAYIKQRAVIETDKIAKSVLDPVTVETLLTKTPFKNGRAAWGFYYNGTLCGYAIVYKPEAVLDLLYVDNNHRNKNIATTALKKLGIRSAAVDRDNQPAIALYLSLGIDVIYADE